MKESFTFWALIGASIYLIIAGAGGSFIAAIIGPMCFCTALIIREIRAAAEIGKSEGGGNG